ncbi:hypothetical protein BOX15_Mlig013995g3 [Macrostomum lignano]|uniref:BZIP domain-containing protein n=1 Tax=Macrostomum lignano TaxID=282301 RepID=A0A267ECF2_9PLAT|nr:hypothetical protein BOX15_Mlig013995g3 [Macrostomum lignano]
MKHCQAAVAPAAQTAEDARRKKNREAARLCRLKKKQRQQRLKEAFQSLTERNRHLSTIAEKLGRLYAASLAYHASQSAFLAYLKRNPGWCATRTRARCCSTSWRPFSQTVGLLTANPHKLNVYDFSYAVYLLCLFTYMSLFV